MLSDRPDDPPLEKPAASLADLPFNLEQAEKILIWRALRHADGNVSAAARLLGIDRGKIYRRFKYGGNHPSADCPS